MSGLSTLKDGKLVRAINLRALQIYKDLYGDLRILPDFILRTKSFHRVPAYFNGYKLGRHVTFLREWYKTDKDVFNQEELKRVEEMGLVWQLGDPKVELVYLAFKVYKNVHSHCDVPIEFVVPNSDEWPNITWGLRLGDILHSIRSEGIHKAIHGELKALGVNFNAQSSSKSKFDRVYDGLKAYKEIHGDLEIPRKFVIPADSEDFPKHTIGLQLGYELFSIRKGRFSEHIQKLKHLGVTNIDTSEEDDKFERVLEALIAYKNLKGNLLVPNDFMFPKSESGDDKFAGMKLGRIVKSIRKEGRFAQFRDKLEEIGFVFNDGKNKPIKEVV